MPVRKSASLIQPGPTTALSSIGNTTYKGVREGGGFSIEGGGMVQYRGIGSFIPLSRIGNTTCKGQERGSSMEVGVLGVGGVSLLVKTFELTLNGPQIVKPCAGDKQWLDRVYIV